MPITSTDSGIELCVVHPDIQKSLWKSVVQITIDDTAGTAIIVDETNDFFYILTNLHLFDDSINYLSDSFQNEIQKPLKVKTSNSY